MDSTSPIIDIRDLSMRFGSVKALDKVSFSIGNSRIAGFIGSDGAGKSTLLRLIAGMMPPVSGEIVIDDRSAKTCRHELKSVIGYMPQRFGLYEDLTVDENINFFLDIFGIFGEERKKRKELFLGFSNLLPFVDRLAGDLSGGMKQKLGLACVLVHQPKILVLDEPTNGVDPVSRREFWEILFQMKKEGMTILVSTAYLDEGEKCDMLGLMHESRLLEFGPPDYIRGDFKELEDALIHRISTADEGLAHDGFQL